MVSLRGYLVDDFNFLDVGLRVRDLVNYCFCPVKFYLTRFLGLSDRLGFDSIIGRIVHFGYYFASENYFSVNCRGELFGLVYNFLLDRFGDVASSFEIECISRWVVDFRFNFPPIGRSVRFEVDVSSGRFNVSGCIDMVENGVPVEVKCRDKLYDCDLIQLCWYALLLEDNFNVDVDFGFIDLIGGMRRVRVDFDDDLRLRAIDVLRDAVKFIFDFDYSKLICSGRCDFCDLRSECRVLINL